MCNLYNMTATVDEMRRMFGSFDGDRANLPTYDEIYPGRTAPVLRRSADGLSELPKCRKKACKGQCLFTPERR